MVDDWFSGDFLDYHSTFDGEETTIVSNIAILAWVNTHGILCIVIWIITSTTVGFLPAPTKDSSKFYTVFFPTINALMISLARLKPKVEASPNFGPAVQNLIKNGGKIENS